MPWGRTGKQRYSFILEAEQPAPHPAHFILRKIIFDITG